MIREYRHRFKFLMERGFVLGRWHIPNRLEEPLGIEPIDPFERCKLHVLQRAPRAAAPNHLRLEEPDDRLGQGIVIRIADAADRRFDAGLGQALGVANREVRSL